MNSFLPFFLLAITLGLLDFLRGALSLSNGLLAQPTVLFFYGVFCVAPLLILSVFFLFADLLIARLASRVTKKDSHALGLIFSSVFLASVLFVVFGENLPEKLSRYPQYFIKTILGAPLFAFFISLAFLELNRRHRYGMGYLFLGNPWVRGLYLAAVLVFCAAMDLFWKPDQYFYTHLLFKLAFLSTLLFVFYEISPRLRVPGLVVRIFLVVMISALFIFPDASQSAKALLMRNTSFAGPFLSMIKSALDLDHDGYSAMLGGGDTDDHDPSVNPAAAEIPNNGKDDNGHGGDLLLSERVLSLGSSAAVKRPNIFFITVCSVRKDHMGLYGYPRNTTPNLWRLAEEAGVFTNAYTSYPRTPIAVSGLLTGRHGMRFIYSSKDRFEEYDALQTMLKAHGYRTVSVLPSRWFEPGTFHSRGFDVFDNTSATLKEHNGKRLVTGDKVVDKSIGYLESSPQPFFLFLLNFDAHDEYIGHAEHRFGDGAIDRYDSEIAFMDAQIGRLFDWLKQKGLWEDTVIVVVGDHGEEFYDHGGTDHGTKIYEELVAVPLILKLPGETPRTISSPVSTVSVTPTLIDLLGIETGKAFDAESLLPVMRESERTAPSDIFLAGTLRRGLISGSYKLIYDVQHHFFELYDLKLDPREKMNIFDREKRIGRALTLKLYCEMDRVSYGKGKTKEEL